MIFYLTVIIGTVISSCFVGKLDFELDDPIKHLDRRTPWRQ
jgi:hypothetical protein